jgi:tetratricopeptide (TPR) repeat protein
MRVIISVLIILPVLSITAYSQMSPRDRYLDPSFVEGADYSAANEEKNGPAASRLLAEGITLYKQKKDTEAITKYEEALELYAAPEIYYHYGNSLSNIGELIYSVRAYEYAIQKNFSSPELAWFNMACSLSRMKKMEKTCAALENAIRAGYPSIENVRDDPDLAFIRGDSHWSVKFVELKKLFDRGNIPLPSGKKLVLGSANTRDEYQICPDGKAVLFRAISEIKEHKKYGTWKFSHYILTITWNRETGKKGVGRPEYCAAVCEYKKYASFSNAVNIREIIRWQDVESGKNGPSRVMPLTDPCE